MKQQIVDYSINAKRHLAISAVAENSE